MWKTILAVLGAVTGVYLGFLAALCCVWLNRTGGEMKGMAIPSFVYLAPAGAALLSSLGFWLGSVLDRRSGGGDVSQMRRFLLATFGAAVGSIIGSVIGMTAPELLESFGESVAYAGFEVGFFLGPPIGAVLFCVLGLWFGWILDRRACREAPPK